MGLSIILHNKDQVVFFRDTHLELVAHSVMTFYLCLPLYGSAVGEINRRTIFSLFMRNFFSSIIVSQMNRRKIFTIDLYMYLNYRTTQPKIAVRLAYHLLWCRRPHRILENKRKNSLLLLLYTTNIACDSHFLVCYGSTRIIQSMIYAFKHLNKQRKPSFWFFLWTA